MTACDEIRILSDAVLAITIVVWVFKGESVAMQCLSTSPPGAATHWRLKPAFNCHEYDTEFPVLGSRPQGAALKCRIPYQCSLNDNKPSQHTLTHCTCLIYSDSLLLSPRLTTPCDQPDNGSRLRSASYNCLQNKLHSSELG